jgi:hypothetical protein
MGKQQYIFMAGGDACGACSALAGTISDTPLGSQHDNCMCDSIPLSAGEDCPTYETNQVGTTRYGPGGGSARVEFEITVTCCDGSTIGETFEIDLGEEPGGRSVDDVSAEIDADLDLEAQGLADGCPDDADDNVA